MEKLSKNTDIYAKGGSIAPHMTNVERQKNEYIDGYLKK